VHLRVLAEKLLQAGQLLVVPSGRAHDAVDAVLHAEVLGAHGRMGSEAVRAVEAAEGLDLVAALDHSDSLQELVEAQARCSADRRLE
jgi:hypothetical protein